MKQMKKLLCSLLMVCMVLAGTGIMPQTVQAKTVSGNDGEIHWEIKGDTLTLSAVKGTNGRMKDYGFYWDEEKQQNIQNPDAPWEKSGSMKNVKNIILKNGVTELGNMAFSFNTSVKRMTIAGTIKKIPSMFCWNARIDCLMVCDGVEEISSDAFMNCKIYTAVFSKSLNKIDLFSFCSIGDVAFTYLTNVYGYKNSVASNFVKEYNKSVVEKELYMADQSVKGISFHELDNSFIFSKAKAPSSFTVNKGKSKTLKITLPAGLTQVTKYTGNPADVKVTFKSSNPKVATVSSNGKVTGKKKGTAKITVTMQTKTGAKKTVAIKVRVK